MFEEFKNFLGRIFSFGGDAAVALESDDLEGQIIADGTDNVVSGNTLTHVAPIIGLGEEDEEPHLRRWRGTGALGRAAVAKVEPVEVSPIKPKRVKRASDRVYPAKPKPPAKRKKAAPKKATAKKKTAPKK